MALIKQDINFLENPLWFQNEKLASKKEDGYTWKDKEGYGNPLEMPLYAKGFLVK